MCGVGTCSCEVCGGAGRVELGGRALLPPGIDDLVLSIFDDEPTSIISYFLANRCVFRPCAPCTVRPSCADRLLSDHLLR